MVKAELSGSHAHVTINGVSVHIWLRDGIYLARGRYLNQVFGVTLGSDTVAAASKLRQLLVDLDNGTFIRPSEARDLPISNGRVPRLTLRELVNQFLAEKRKFRGSATARAYATRLAPVLDFGESPAALRRWRLASAINHDFVVDLRTFLHQCRTMPNGRPGGKSKPMKGRQIINVLECLRTVVNWARRAEVRRLPASWVSPLTQELIGSPPSKDPLRDDPVPLELRIKLAGVMDRWQLTHLALSMVLPSRPEEATGLLVSEVDFEMGWLKVGTRFDGADFTKSKSSFTLPFPPELSLILHECIGGRAAGPLLRNRKTYEGRKNTIRLATPQELNELVAARLLAAPSKAVTCDNDRKAIVRRLLVELGGVSTDRLAAEFKNVIKMAGIQPGITLYDLRRAVTTAMSACGMPHLDLRYLTSHSTGDILNEYASLDPIKAMVKYFANITPLLAAISDRARMLGIIDESCPEQSVFDLQSDQGVDMIKMMS